MAECEVEYRLGIRPRVATIRCANGLPREREAGFVFYALSRSNRTTS